MTVISLIEAKRNNPLMTKTAIKLLDIIKALIELCIRDKHCIHCPESYGTNINKLNCSFKVKPKDLTPDKWTEFVDDFVQVKGFTGKRR